MKWKGYVKKLQGCEVTMQKVRAHLLDIAVAKFPSSLTSIDALLEKDVSSVACILQLFQRASGSLTRRTHPSSLSLSDYQIVSLSRMNSYLDSNLVTS